MNYLIDTNVISEIMKRRPSESVLSWMVENQSNAFLSAITIEELRFGELMMSHGKRRNKLHELINSIVEEYAAKVLIFDGASAEQCAVFHEMAIRAGRTPTIEDLMIAAIANVNNCILVTRNIRDFDYLDIETINPFES